MSAPHLPKQDTAPQDKKSLKTIPVSFGVVVIATLASLVTSLLVMIWLYPEISPTTPIYGGFRGVENQDISPEQSVERLVRERTVSLYDMSRKINEIYYTDDGYLSEAVLLSSDGWAVLYDPDARVTRASGWEAVDGQGIVHQLESVVIDPVSGLTYIKLVGAGYRVTSFYEWNDTLPKELLWAINQNSWHIARVSNLENIFQSNTNHTLQQRTVRYTLSAQEKEGSLLLSEDGDFVGFVHADGTLLPAWLIPGQLSYLLAEGETQYATFPYTGKVITAMVDPEDGYQQISGFYIATSPTEATTTTLGVGDVIVRIQNQEFTAESLPRLIMNAPDQMTITVLRDDKEIDMILQKETVQQ